MIKGILQEAHELGEPDSMVSYTGGVPLLRPHGFDGLPRSWIQATLERGRWSISAPLGRILALHPLGKAKARLLLLVGWIWGLGLYAPYPFLPLFVAHDCGRRCD